MPAAQSFANDEMVVAVDSAAVDIEGLPYILKRDVTRFRGDHPVVKANPHLFKVLDPSYDEQARNTGVESATAAPGERRRKA